MVALAQPEPANDDSLTAKDNKKRSAEEDKRAQEKRERSDKQPISGAVSYLEDQNVAGLDPADRQAAWMKNRPLVTVDTLSAQATERAQQEVVRAVVDRVEQHTVALGTAADSKVSAETIKTTGHGGASEATVSAAAMQIAAEVLRQDQTLTPEQKRALHDKVVMEAWLRASGIDQSIAQTREQQIQNEQLEEQNRRDQKQTGSFSNN